MDQYLTLCNRIIQHGKWVNNERTGKRCLTIINADLVYDVENNKFPLITTRKAFYRSAIAELLGYIRGYDNAADFRRIGTKTWDSNANDNADWLSNPHRKGKDDCGFIYGKVARNFPKPDGGSIDLLKSVIHNLSKGYDSRGEIITFYLPVHSIWDAYALVCTAISFSLLDGILHLNSTQRSCDVPLGLTFNMVQVFVLLALIAQITNNRPGQAFHKIVNAHIYEDQLELMRDTQLKRSPYPSPRLSINPDIKSLEDIETWVTLEDFKIEEYEHHDPINYTFSV